MDDGYYCCGQWAWQRMFVCFMYVRHLLRDSANIQRICKKETAEMAMMGEGGREGKERESE